MQSAKTQVFTALGGKEGCQGHSFDARNVNLHNSTVLFGGTFPSKPLPDHVFEQRYGTLGVYTSKVEQQYGVLGPKAS